MYKKSVQGWLKHLDFMILDVVCLWISFTLAFNMRHGSLDVLANSLYRDMMWSLALMDIVVIFFFDSLKNVLKRGFYQEFVMTVKQTCLITLCSVFYLFTFKEAENYSRLVLGYTAALYLLLSYVLRYLWKNCLRKYFGGAEKRSLLIVTVSDIVDTVIDNIKNKNYGDYFVTGVCILDKKAKGRVIDGVTVVADEDDLVEYVCREWVDEVFINIPESEPYPAELLDKFIEMGVVVHMKLAKSQNLLGKKQFVEHLGTYTVLTTSINSVSRRQIILKRMMDIAGGLAGCIITGILCIFVGPAIYIQSPGPIFFKQTRVGKNGKMFQMYKFRSMYMDAEERKAELMKENRVQDGMMFKLDFDPRIIGSKKLPDGTIKKGVGNFIRDWSLDEFPQFLNVLKGDMSLVGTRPPTVDEWDKYELHHRARLATKPGLTGMWQVSGRSNITDFEEVVKLDKQYISEWTINRMWNCMRQYLGDEIYLAVRTPAQWRTLRSEKEFRQKKYAHLALFDDGILGSMTHLGTFGTELREAAGWAQAWTRKEEMEFVNCLTEDMPCGGEVVACTENDRMYEAKFIVNELKKMHITYLDSTYDMKALDLWKSISWDGFDNLKIWKGYSLYEYIGEHLGYRLVVRTVELKPIRRGRAEFMFEIENTGFGRVFQETELFLIMKNRNETREVPISMDMRKIQAGTRICGKTVIKLMEGRVSLKLQRKKDGRIIHFANKNSTDTLYLGSLHCGKIYLSEE